MAISREEWLMAQILTNAAISLNAADCGDMEAKETQYDTAARQNIIREASKIVSRYQADSLFSFAKALEEFKNASA